jgi:hypothetical protein
MKKTLKYSLSVYEDHAKIEGWIPTDIFLLMIKACKKEGFVLMKLPDDGSAGFELVKDE